VLCVWWVRGVGAGGVGGGGGGGGGFECPHRSKSKD